MVEACSTNVGEEEHVLLVGKPEGEKSLRRPRRKWLDNIKIDLGEIE
jgi:hypothetical protein